MKIRIRLRLPIICVILIELATACYNKNDYDYRPGIYDGYISVTSSSDSILADGKSTAIIYAAIDKSASLKTIDFTTSRGSFIENGTKAFSGIAKFAVANNNDLIAAKVELQSTTTVGSATVSAKINNVNPPGKLIRFYRAYPTKIAVETNKFSVVQGLNNEVSATATISRNSGIPSIGQLTNFIVLTQSRDTLLNTIRRVGFYRSLLSLSDDKGTTSVTFTSGNPAYLGRLVVLATTVIPASAGTKILKDSTIIYVTP